MAAEPAPVREPEPAAPAVTERPKLQLKPRTLPVAEVGAPVAASSIFGAAKPVNTAAREREIEERMKSDGVKHDEECVVVKRRFTETFGLNILIFSFSKRGKQGTKSVRGFRGQHKSQFHYVATTRCGLK